MKELLKQLGYSSSFTEWVDEKSWDEVYKTCERGDWLIWLHSQTAHGNTRERILVKGLAANTVRHLMKGMRSINATGAAIAFGKGEINETQLEHCRTAYATAYDTHSNKDYIVGAADVSYAAADAASAYAIYDTDAISAVADAVETSGGSRAECLKNIANLVRANIPIENFNI